MTRRAHLIIEHPAWKPLYRPLIRRACTAALDHEGVTQGELSILCTGDAQLQELNRDFRGKDKPTNVISFPSGEYPPSPLPRASFSRLREKGRERALSLGDIALSLDTVAREAVEQGKRFEDHLAHLTVHGILHLLGHDHEAEGEAEVMESKEISILQKLNIKNPYR